MKKSSSRVPLLAVLLVVAAGALNLVKRREAKQRGTDVVESSTTYDMTKEAGRKADEERAHQEEKTRMKVAKVMSLTQTHGMLQQLRKTFVDGKPTAATQKLAREMASRHGYKDAKRIATDYPNDFAGRREKQEAEKAYNANINGVWEKKKE